MSDVAQKVERARSVIDPDWSDERARMVMRGMQARKRRRARTRVALGAALVVLLAIGGIAISRRDRAPKMATQAPQPAATDVRAAKPHAFPLEAQAAVESRDDGSFDLVRGGARFVGDEPMSVRAGDVTIEGTGTVVVERAGARARVTVEHGHFIIAWAIGAKDLGEGESGMFPPEQRADPAPQHSGPVVTPWRKLAESGDYDAAWTALSASGPTSVHQDAADLMLAADVARLSGHPEQAVAPLDDVLSKHAKDPRAPLAAFTLGRIQLDQLGHPRDAAAAFERARALDPNGPLAEDALAREVEAWSRAGESSKARDLADAYVRTFPQGRRLRAVKKFGALD